MIYNHERFKKRLLIAALTLLSISKVSAQAADNIIKTNSNSFGLWIFAGLVIIPLLFIIGKLYLDFKLQLKKNNEWNKEGTTLKFSQYLKNFDRAQIHTFVALKKKKCCGKCKGDGGCGVSKKAIGIILVLLFFAENIFAKAAKENKA